MTLAKALKRKNILVGEISKLKERLAAQNVRSGKQTPDYKNQDVLTELLGKVEELVNLKAAIAKANAEVYPKIFRKAELEGLIKTVKGLDTKDGVIQETRGAFLADSGHEVEYHAQIKQIEVDRMVAEYEQEIQQIQDALDEFNFTHTIEV